MQSNSNIATPIKLKAISIWERARKPCFFYDCDLMKSVLLEIGGRYTAIVVSDKV